MNEAKLKKANEIQNQIRQRESLIDELLTRTHVGIKTCAEIKIERFLYYKTAHKTYDVRLSEGAVRHLIVALGKEINELKEEFSNL